MVDKDTHNIYAAKVLNKSMVRNKDKGIESVINEIEIYNNINHANIVKLYEIHETKGSIYLIMELCEGGPIIMMKKQ